MFNSESHNTVSIVNRTKSKYSLSGMTLAVISIKDFPRYSVYSKNTQVVNWNSSISEFTSVNTNSVKTLSIQDYSVLKNTSIQIYSRVKIYK